MKILIATGIYPPDIGGPATYSKILVDELPKLGWQVVLLKFGEVARYPKIIRHIIYFLKALLVAKNVDLIYALDPVSVGLPATLVAFFLRKKLIIKIVGDYAWEQGQQRFGINDNLDIFLNKKYGFPVSLLRGVQKFCAQRADLVIVPSFYLQNVIKKWGIAETKIKVIYNAVEEYEAANFLVSEKEIKILTVCRLVPWKGVGILLEVMSDLLKNNIKFKFYIIGDGPEKKMLVQLCSKLGLEKCVFFLGSLSHGQVLSHLKSAALFVLNSSYEGMSHVVLEALSQNCKILASNVGGNPEIINLFPGSGLLFEYNNREEIKNKILKILMWPKQNSAEQVQKYFGIDKMLESTNETLKNICRF